ncbi:hypothetical protein EVAR_17527_1 [Eumeta japonica]|uniref:Uncharacterized protein n=1 Tax=Eumeta variegata TaxID=151549 RepID=A0A4C1WSB3_EUMVA|nr:hypothetical protein EVAR_17527_1 [Eumeta japonica]
MGHLYTAPKHKRPTNNLFGSLLTYQRIDRCAVKRWNDEFPLAKSRAVQAIPGADVRIIHFSYHLLQLACRWGKDYFFVGVKEAFGRQLIHSNPTLILS